MLRQGLLVFIPLFAVAFSACGKPGKARWESFPVTIYADDSVSTSSAKSRDLEDAMTFWESHAGKKLFDFRGRWAGQFPPYNGSPENPGTLLGNVVFFQNPWAYGAGVAGRTIVVSDEEKIHSSIVMINANTHFCAGDCAFDGGASSQRRVFAHELGHFLGLDHDESASNVMYPELQRGASLTNLEVNAGALSELVD